MNLHVVIDSPIVNTFYNNLEALGLLSNNRFVVRTNAARLRYVRHPLPYGKLYNSSFRRAIGDTRAYDKVFIHQFSPLMYRWVATQQFKELNWMVWGADLYGLPFLGVDFYDELTRKEYVSKHPFTEWAYLLKVWLTAMPFRSAAYAKVDNILTWMNTEFEFALKNIPSLQARHQFFFYENHMPYHKLDQFLADRKTVREVPRIIVGNSGYSTNNHLDAVNYITQNGIRADLRIPVSYGDKKYTAFLKNRIQDYPNGDLRFVDEYMDFDKYATFLADSDALVMNNIRPQGYGNVLMMLYMGKKVFFNPKNISLPDLADNGIVWSDWSEMNSPWQAQKILQNKESLMNLFSHQRLENVYQKLFG